MLPALAVHPRARGGLAQRLGRVRRCAGSPLWLHGSSAGDVVALLPVLQELRRQGVPCALSAYTRAGHQMAALRAGGEASPIFRAPLDLPSVVRRVLRRLGPRGLILECLELWPRLLDACAAAAIPVSVINGRLSERSLAAYRRLPALFGPRFGALRRVSALSDEDARRFVAAGVPAERVGVTCNSKHAALAVEPPRPDGGRRLVLGSLHREEEEALLPWVLRLHAQLPALRTVLAPRYPHRARSLLRRARGLGLQAEPASAAAQGGGAAITVVDRLGGLAESYRGARVAFVGGSLAARGGHNVMEPAAKGVPVLVGPHVQHCRQEVQALGAGGGAWVVREGEEFFARARALLLDDHLYQQSAHAAWRAAAALAHAARQGVGEICEVMR